MAVELLSDRNRALGAAGTFLANALLLAALLSLSTTAPPGQRSAGLVSFDVAQQPPPAPPSHAARPAGAAPPSRGATRAPAPPNPPRPLPTPTPVPPAVDAGSRSASGAGAAAGSGAGQGGQGSGSGSGGAGSGAVTPPVHIYGRPDRRRLQAQRTAQGRGRDRRDRLPCAQRWRRRQLQHRALERLRGHRQRDLPPRRAALQIPPCARLWESPDRFHPANRFYMAAEVNRDGHG